MGCEEFFKKRPWEGGGGGRVGETIFKIVNFLVISISIQNNFLINKVILLTLQQEFVILNLLNLNYWPHPLKYDRS